MTTNKKATPKKEAEYTVMGDELSPASAFLQAAHLLDMAALFSVERKDLDKIHTTAVLWMELGDKLFREDDEEDDEEVNATHIGFGKVGSDERIDK